MRKLFLQPPWLIQHVWLLTTEPSISPARIVCINVRIVVVFVCVCVSLWVNESSVYVYVYECGYMAVFELITK